jgi:hypothetical protein
MIVLLGKESIEVSPTLESSVADIKADLARITGFNSIRLIHGGKTLSDDCLVSNIPGGLFCKIRMIGDYVDWNHFIAQSRPMTLKMISPLYHHRHRRLR